MYYLWHREKCNKTEKHAPETAENEEKEENDVLFAVSENTL